MEYFLHIVITASLIALATLGLNLILGRGKILHFGPLATSLVSAYAVFLTLKATNSYLAAIAMGCVANVIVSGLFAWLSLRLDGDAFGILSIATHLSVLAVVLNWTDLTNGALGIVGIPRMQGMTSLSAFAGVALALLALYAWIVHRITYGPTGRALVALAENPAHAQAIGVGAVRPTLIAFFVGGIGPLLAQIFYPQYLGLLHPSVFLFPALIFDIMCVVAGGPGSVYGTVIATTLVVLFQEGLRFLPLPLSAVGPVRLMLFGIILLAAVYARRDTLFPGQRKV